MKTLISIIIFTFLATQLFSQASPKNEVNVAGFVKSGDNNIPFVTISINGTALGTVSNELGYYSFSNIPEGEYILEANAVGYRTLEKKITITRDNSVELNLELIEDLIGLNEVVVSSDRQETKRKESSVMISSINSQVFAITQSKSLADGLDFSSGMRTENNCQNCGFTQVRMNGLEGPYSQILVNSRPIFSGLAGVYGLELFPANMVERVEVIKGGGSALFGGNAIAGTINIITKEPKHNSFSISSHLVAIGVGHEHSSEIAYDKLLNFDASLVNKNSKSGISIYGTLRNADPFDENSDSFSEEVLIKNQTVGFNTYYKPSKRTKLSLNLYNIHEFRRGGNMFEYLPHETDITEQVEHDILGASLSFDLYSAKYNSLALYTSLQTVDRNSYYGSNKNPDGYGVTGDETSSSGLVYTANFDVITKSKFITGLDFFYNHLEDVKLGSNGNENAVISNQSVKTLGSFVQYEMNFDIITLSGGLRFDNYTIHDVSNELPAISNMVASPRANVLVNFNDNLQFRSSFASGYRAPQIFDEDLHIETSGARRITHVNSPDLTQETSYSYNASFAYSNIFGSSNPVQSEFIVEGFYTRLINPFANEYSPMDEFGNIEYVRVNSEDDAYVFGANFEANVALSKKILIQAGYTYQKSEYEVAQQWGEEDSNVSKSFIRTPNSYGFLVSNIKFTKKFETSITGTYTGSMLIPHFGLNAETDVAEEIYALENGHVIAGEQLEASESFLDMGINFSYSVDIQKLYFVKFSAGVKNIFNQTQKTHDRGIFRDAGYIYGPCTPRTLTFGIEIYSKM